MTTIAVANPTTTSNNESNEQQVLVAQSFHQILPVVVPSLPSKKRRNNTDGEENVQWAKKGVMKGISTVTMIPNDDSNTMLWSNTHSESRIQFLMVHFNLLQALYKHENKDVTQNDSSSLLSRTNDDALDTKRQQNSHELPLTNLKEPIWNDTNIWYPIQSFMIHQRELLLQIQERITHISHLHQAALEYCSSKTPTKVVPDHGTSSNPVVVVSSSLLPTSSTNDSFRIIANIIGQQSKVIQQQKHVPSIMVLQQLLQEVTRRITALQDIYDAQQFQPTPTYVIKNHKDRDNDEEHDRAEIQPKVFRPSSTIYNDRSYRTEVQYKIQLWSLLAHDLKEVLRN